MMTVVIQKDPISSCNTLLMVCFLKTFILLISFFKSLLNTFYSFLRWCFNLNVPSASWKTLGRKFKEDMNFLAVG